MSAPALVTWIIWSDSAPLRTPTELGRCRAADKPAAEKIAAERFPGRRILVQSAASARVAEPVKVAKPLPSYGGARARAKAKAKRDPSQTLTPPEAA
jgi:hypothetical protein